MAPDKDDLTLPEADRRELILWTVACVERLVPIFHHERPYDSRLLEALAGARRFAAGELGVGSVRRLAFQCHAAARDASGSQATAVARVVGQAVAVAHMAGHSRQIGRYTRIALQGVERTAELQWQYHHVPERYRTYVFGKS